MFAKNLHTKMTSHNLIITQPRPLNKVKDNMKMSFNLNIFNSSNDCIKIKLCAQ
ncbi:hypothetical protein [Phthorimaea operculella granulovirus]|uniref:Uncharacterized protein n=1 Tax=Phthorimaea operculella granulovirus TaxID=192584 RepID=Q8JS41_9BBAC|nr:hypothetical protein [Phthorimaea operculella granulovirus]AAM70216.1 unknown [Phthorimaea operculella granulovirus]ANY57407.1 hypothetical protein PhopGVgp018 [Phthorimaea operculella granulovirus]QBH65853.1 hypothetical protein PhopGVgp018 [Phthorimaea operculella granulovirus]QBH65983.1 hypothetical protein PhopGVgp018 [Phthorimaea operculella granulovirus]QBH66633.1 hypothetical protein PhopGVgp018 [Phthorimaea operculella granulovirus]